RRLDPGHRDQHVVLDGPWPGPDDIDHHRHQGPGRDRNDDRPAASPATTVIEHLHGVDQHHDAAHHHHDHPDHHDPADHHHQDHHATDDHPDHHATDDLGGPGHDDSGRS